MLDFCFINLIELVGGGGGGGGDPIYTEPLRLRIPNSQRQSSWLFSSSAKKLNQELPGSNSLSGQSGS